MLEGPFPTSPLPPPPAWSAVAKVSLQTFALEPHSHHLPDAQGPILPAPHLDLFQTTLTSCCLQDPVDSSPAVLVKRFNVTQQKELEVQLSSQQEVLQRWGSGSSARLPWHL